MGPRCTATWPRVSSTSEVEEIKRELEDRFGRLPIESEDLLRVAKLKLLARELLIEKIGVSGGKVEICLSDASPLYSRSSSGGKHLFPCTSGRELEETFNLLFDFKIKN